MCGSGAFPLFRVRAFVRSTGNPAWTGAQISLKEVAIEVREFLHFMFTPATQKSVTVGSYLLQALKYIYQRTWKAFLWTTRLQLFTIGPTVDLPTNMQEGKRRSLRSQAAPPGAVAVNGMAGGVAEHSRVCGVPSLESLHSLSSRSNTASPTPTVGTAIGSYGATSPALDAVAPQQRLRRPMNSFLLYSNEHRKTRLLTSARHVARLAPFVLSRGCTRRSRMMSCTLSDYPPPLPTFLIEQLEVQSTRNLRL